MAATSSWGSSGPTMVAEKTGGEVMEKKKTRISTDVDVFSIDIVSVTVKESVLKVFVSNEEFKQIEKLIGKILKERV